MLLRRDFIWEGELFNPIVSSLFLFISSKQFKLSILIYQYHYLASPSLVGTGLIVLGLYCVLWGKGQDNSAAQKPDEGKGLADDKTLEISINDHPLTNPDTGERK